MDWDKIIKSFRNYLLLEKALSINSIEAYLRDVEKLHVFLLMIKKKDVSINSVDLELLWDFVEWANKLGMTERSQARMISGIRAFFKFLMIENYIETNPSLLLELPKLGSKLPVVLSINEIDLIVTGIDLSKADGHRNKAIIETLYGCGLRVSELINLKISNLYFSENYIRIVGKGDKERLVPIGKTAKKEIRNYFSASRNNIEIAKGQQDFVFLNRRGKKLSRVMIFNIVKDLAEKAELKKNVSPHTFRHSFATHLVEGGANLRAVQDMLGHESILTTEIYTHLDRTYLQEIMMEYHPRSKKNINKKR
ncbi:MAG: site-specific tyrosine recombinase XerD [Bacteroidota bacterium]|nr:site-specific tyrosine recombinase XerD [Bacteroidota bacterium]